MVMIDFVLVAILAVVTYCVAADGAWSAGMTCLCTILAGILAMNFFEPLATALFPASGVWSVRADVISLVGLFVVFVLLLRLATEKMSPRFMHVQPMVHEIGRWACGFLTGYVTMAFLLTALHTAPFPREFAGFRPERMNLFGAAAPDRQWLGFNQWISERVLSKGRIFDGRREQLGTYPNTIWPSFPIRYATRREQVATIGAVGPAGSGSGPKRAEPRQGGGKTGF
jgi:hypothetical protein